MLDNEAFFHFVAIPLTRFHLSEGFTAWPCKSVALVVMALGIRP
jgi:hypothetical protein